MQSLCVLLVVCCVSSLVSSLAPRLDVEDLWVIRTYEQDYFELLCEGDKPLKWSWNSSLHKDDAEIHDAQQEIQQYPYKSTLSVFEVRAGDTGFYNCYYEDTTDIHTGSDSVASTYIYVYDGETIFVNPNSFVSVSVKTNEKLVLDCRTTLPNVTLLLEKNEQPFNMDSYNVRWDPKIGFVLLSLTIHDTGIYKCVSESTHEQRHIHVTVNRASSELASPIIDEGVNPNYVLGHPFSLKCILKGNISASLEWSYPNATVYKTTQVKDYDDDADKNSSSSSLVSTLHVANATLDHTGTYTCTAATLLESKQHSLYIQVLDSLKPYVRIRSPQEILVNLENTTTVKWKAEVFSFPQNPTIVYKNWRGDVLTDNERMEIKFESADAFSWFFLHNITAADFGRYTLTATNGDNTATETAAVNLNIMSAPEVEIEGVPEFVWPQSKVEVTCLAQGFPLPDVVWEFQPCVSGHPSCSNYQQVKVDGESMSTPGPGNIMVSSFLFSPQSSGYLRCVANNSLATLNHTVPLLISDVGGVYMLNHTVHNTTTVIASSAVLTVITNDDFRLTCAANKLIYNKVTLHTPQSYVGEVKQQESTYSLLQETTLQRVSVAVQGKYSCSAQSYQQHQDVHAKTVTINVLEEAKVKFLQDSNMKENKTVIVKETPFFLNCTVAGTPQPTITWKKDGKPLTHTSAFFDNKTTFLWSDSQRIEFKYEFKEKHVGRYTCTANNRLNTLIRTLVLTVPAAGLSTPAKIGLTVACLGIGILIITVVVLFKRVKTERKFRKSFRANELYLFEKGNIGQLNPDCSADEQAELLPYGQEWEVPREQISLGKQLGSGAFGRVVKAKVVGLEGPATTTTTVAIKMCKSQADQAQIRALALELKIMIHLGKHLNIVNLMGANTTHIGKGELWILVEYCRFGNLLVFMHRHRNNFINQIDANTGHIDTTKLMPHFVAAAANTATLSSPGGSWRDVNSRGSVSQDVVPATPTTPLILSPPPSGHTRPAPQAHNPTYNPMSPSHTPPHSPLHSPHNTTQATSSHECCSGELKTPSTTATSDGRVQNVYFTSTSDSSGSHAPLSPTESSLLDSEGKMLLVPEVGSVPGVNCAFTTTHLVCWAWQVAQGMDYLASRKVLHGDLAARNLLLADDNVVKISDFGLSRDMYKKDIYMKKTDDLMPIKWISVEAIRDRIFSVQSDVWAFGVALWEIFSLGSNPYPGIQVNMDFLPLLEQGYRMDCPKYANQDIYELMLECWEGEPMNRPSFREAVHRLDSLLQPELKGEYLSMNDQYVRMNEERFKEQPDYLNMFTPPDYENMTNKADEDLKPQYINLQVAGSVARDTTDAAQQHTTIQSPEVVSYCNTPLSPSPASLSSTSNPHYLPMDCTRHSPNPEKEEEEVFSPDPSQAPRFTFTQDQDNMMTTQKDNKQPYLNSTQQQQLNPHSQHSTLITKNNNKDTSSNI
nr:receptor tyrosine kinase PVR2B1a [Carcinus maenas]